MTDLQQIAVRTRALADELVRSAHTDVPNLGRVAEIAVQLRIAANRTVQIAGALAVKAKEAA